ncbi:MAG: hypothetical protein WC897_00225 [Candidatus Gracilibacteria bacterium]
MLIDPFSVSDHEKELRKKFGFGEVVPKLSAKERFQYLGAFWPHWNLHKRKCDRTGRPIVSIFRPDCPYPIWHRDEWIANAMPPYTDFDFGRSFFEQAWELFQKCPLPHAFQSNNQNCEYTDDWYYSKNCYLCHSGQNNEDCRYCYGCDSIKSCYYSVFSFNSELCTDLINSTNCFGSLFLLNCKNVFDSSFLYDCRDCNDCLFCFNLRNKKYCFGNKQLSKEEFEQKKLEWDFRSLKNYEEAKKIFADMFKNVAWHRALQIDKCENSTGNFIHNSKDCENCYLLTGHENCANVLFCGPPAKTILDSLGTLGSELTFMSSLPVYSYEARFCFSVSHSRYVEYSAYLQNCQYCFGCAGLVNEKYCILNKKYSKEDYFALREKIVTHMQKTGEWGDFFPSHFAPNPYAESLSGFYFPLDESEIEDFRTGENLEKITMKTAEITDIPDSVDALDDTKEKWLSEQIFWDAKFERPFQVQSVDIQNSRTRKVPLVHSYYVDRMQNNLKWMPFSGELRNSICSVSGKSIQTNWPKEYDGRILCEEEYLKFIK